MCDTDLLPVAQGVRRAEDGLGQKVERARAYECATQEAPSQGSPGQSDAAGGRLGKLVSPHRKREAVQVLLDRFGVPEPRSCRVLRQPRAPQRYLANVRADELPLTKRIIELVCTYGRYGFLRITALLHWDGWFVNHKRVERIWRQEGLGVPKEQRKRGRLWFNDGSCVRLRPTHKDHVWSYDFAQSRTHDGRALRMLVIVGHTRECVAIGVARSRKSDDVPERLAWLMATRGVPGHVRSDNRAECTAKAVRAWPPCEWCELLLSRRLRLHPRSFATS